jgi:parallel beta-helix repeat protein
MIRRFSPFSSRSKARVPSALLLMVIVGLSAGLFFAQPAQAATTYNVKDYGATGNGVTDDRSAIQSCIDAAALTGAEAYIPAGTYRITPNGNQHGLELPSNLTVRGDGDASLLVLSGGTDWTRMVYASGKSGIVLQDLKLNVNAASATVGGTGEQRHGVFLTGCASSTIQRVTVVQPLGDGIFLYGSSSNIVIQDNTVIAGTTNNPRVGINVQGADYCTIQRNNVLDFDVAYKAELDSGDPTSTGNKILNNSCSGARSLCLGLNGKSSGRVVDYSVEGNTFSGQGEYNIWANTTTGVTIRNNTLNGGQTGVHAVYDNQSIVIENNTFNNQTYTGVGILNYLSAGASNSIKILSNTFVSANYTQGTVSIWTSQATGIEVGGNTYPSGEVLVNNVAGAPAPNVHDNVVAGSTTTTTAAPATTTTTVAPATTTTASTTTTSTTTTTVVTPSATTTTSTSTTAAPTTSTTAAPTTTTTAAAAKTTSTAKVTITSPTNGSKVGKGTVTFRASVTSTVKIGKVIFYADDKQLAIDARSAYYCSWTTKSLASGSVHTLKAVAYDTSGVQIGSATSQVTIK